MELENLCPKCGRAIVLQDGENEIECPYCHEMLEVAKLKQTARVCTDGAVPSAVNSERSKIVGRVVLGLVLLVTLLFFAGGFIKTYQNRKIEIERGDADRALMQLSAIKSAIDHYQRAQECFETDEVAMKIKFAKGELAHMAFTDADDKLKIAESMSFSENDYPQGLLDTVKCERILREVSVSCLQAWSYGAIGTDKIEERIKIKRKEIASYTAAHEERKRQEQIKRNIERASSFCGVCFGTAIRDCASVVDFFDGASRLVHGHRDYQFSYLYGDYVNSRPFRHFKNGKIYASMTSEKIYEVEFEYSPSRGSTVAVDEAEYRDTLRALRKKYGDIDQEEKSFSGNYVHTFEVGAMTVAFIWVTEGVIDNGKLVLKATRSDYFQQAESESRAYYDSRVKKDLGNREQFENDGVDAL